MAACRSCNAPIIWALTEHGKRIPIDAEPVEGGNVELLDSTDGDGRSVKLALYRPTESLLAEPRYVSHFATCPYAEQHRQR